MPGMPSDRGRITSPEANPRGASRSGDPSTASAQLRAAADVRQDRIKRAKALVKDPLYPPPEVIEAVAKTLAKRLAPRGRKA